jgi:hypothetical protein
MATKKKAKPEPVLVDGRPPPPLPLAEGPLADFIELLHETERAFTGNDFAPPALEKLEKQRAKLRVGKLRWRPGEIHAFASKLGLDLGVCPDSPDRSRAKTRGQWKLQDRRSSARCASGCAAEPRTR